MVCGLASFLAGVAAWAAPILRSRPDTQESRTTGQSWVSRVPSARIYKRTHTAFQAADKRLRLVRVHLGQVVDVLAAAAAEADLAVAFHFVPIGVTGQGDLDGVEQDHLGFL